MKYAALLRGINVGGKNKLPMKDLAELCAECGCTEVTTYIQSGNVVFAAPASGVKALPSRLAAAIESRFGLSVPVVVRSRAQMEAVLTSNPFIGDDPSGKSLAVAFLAGTPSAEAVAALDPQRSPGDRFQVTGSDIYLHLGNGFADSKLTNAWFDSRLKTISTARNWNTVVKLAEMLGVGK